MKVIRSWGNRKRHKINFEQSIEKIREILPHNDGLFSLDKDYKSIKWLKPSKNPKMKMITSKTPYQSKTTSKFCFQT